MHISQFLQPKTDFKSQRAEIINEFVVRINEGRVGTKFKPVTPRSVAILINQHPNLKTLQELYDFLGRCKEAKNFGAYFYFIVKPRN